MGIKNTALIFISFLLGYANQVQAVSFTGLGCSHIAYYDRCRDYMSKPQTKPQIKRAYNLLVNKEGGISKQEARLIAQYQVIQKKDFSSFHIGRPKVVLEDGSSFTVRISGKYSFSKKSVKHYILKIDKSSGEIME